MEPLYAILAAALAVAGWCLRGFFAGRAQKKTEAERDAARVAAKRQGIAAAAKRKEADALRAQRKEEDAIHAADTGGIADRLDDLFT